MSRWAEISAEFWRQQPALLYGLAMLIGCSFGLQRHPLSLLPAALIWHPLGLALWQRKLHLSTLRLLLAAALAIFGYGYTQATIHYPAGLPQKLKGVGQFDIDQFSLVNKHHGKQALYRGRLRHFKAEEKLIAKSIPCCITLNNRLIWPEASRSYEIEGELSEISPHRYILKPVKEKPWISIAGSWSGAAWRQKLKQTFSEYLHGQIDNKRSADFLTGIATGEFEDRLMSQELGRFGLQHIMAISGFHFTIVAAILGFLFYLILPRLLASWLLIILITAYFLILGNSPSILRAWLACIIALFSLHTHRKSSGINSLGLGMLAAFFFNPSFAEQIGFQFSFAVTAAILLLHRPCDYFLQSLWPSRSLRETSRMDKINQHGYCLLILFRQGLALSLAVNLVALPLTLFHFQKFPLMGLIYNLFFPPLVSISMLLLILGSLIGLLIPPLGSVIHALNSHYTHFMLSYAYNMPNQIDLMWRQALSAELLIILLCLIFCIGIYSRETLRAETSKSY